MHRIWQRAWRPLLTLVAAATAGCYSSATLSSPGVVALRDGGKGGEVVVQGEDGQPVKLDPNSEIRFVRQDGTTTSWLVVRDLHVNDDGIFTLDAGEDGKAKVVEGVSWAAIASAEVKNLDHGTTAVAIVAGTVVVVGLVAIVAGSKGSLNLGGLGKGVGQTTVHAVRIAPRLHLASQGGGGSSSAAAPSAAPTSTAVEETASDERLRVNDARPLFGEAERRRSIVRVVGSLEAARDLSARNHAGVTALLRLYNFIELGGGLRYLGSMPTAGGPHADLLGFARIGIHAELDARRRFAFPFAFDLGAGRDLAFYARLAFGLRIRVDEAWSIGVYAFNPTFARYKASAQLGDTPRWSFPSGVEASFAF